MKLLKILLIAWGMACASCGERGADITKPIELEESEVPLLEQSVVGISEEESRRFLEAHSKRRNQVLELDADRMKGMKGAPVWAVLMEWRWGKDTESMIAHADGSASFFNSSRDWAVDGESHPYVKKASLDLVEMAAGFLGEMKSVNSFPVPQDYEDLTCYVITPGGVFAYYVNAQELGKKEHLQFRALFDQWQELQDQHTIVEKKRYAQQGEANGTKGGFEADLDLTGIDWDAKDEKPVKPEELFELINEANRVVVTASPMDKKVLYQSDQKSDIKELGEALSIRKPEQWYHGMCIGTMVVSLYKGEEELLAFSNHHGKSIRCSLWSSDAVIVDPSRWLSWFDARAMPQLRKEVEESRAQQEKSDRNWKKWLAAMPKGVRPAWEGSYGKDGVFDVNPLRKALLKSYPEKGDRIRSLLQWYGSGEGPWNAVPVHEGWAANLIDDYDASEIVAAIDLSKLTDEQFEGAARFIAQSIYPQDYPKELKEGLWDFVKNTKDEDKRARARALIE
ncbi:MAG: hypothetical protein L3J39_18480 [Verrucomicrobiales bacterium]|nr:hypothetical protein [Verrucomicrobiales bacterium]